MTAHLGARSSLAGIPHSASGDAGRRDRMPWPAKIAVQQLEARNLLPAEHVGDIWVPVQEQVAREHEIILMGPARRKATCSVPARETSIDRDGFTIDFEQEKVTRPQGKISQDWAAPSSGKVDLMIGRPA
ncbi:hypothetical protein [Streptomyces sp. NPDC054866]